MSSLLHGDRRGHVTGHMEASRGHFSIHASCHTHGTLAPEEQVEQSPDCGVCAESPWAALKGEEESGREF